MLAKEGARHHGYTGARGYHPLLAIAAGTGEVLMVRLRAGRANTARGAAHFLRETVGRVRYAGAKGQLTVRADSGFYTHAVVALCRQLDVRFSITIGQHASLRKLIEAIPEREWTPVPYWMDGAADVAETTYTPFQAEADAAPVRLIVRRVKPTPRLPTGPLRQLQLSRLHHRPGRGDHRTGGHHRRHAEIENAIPRPSSTAVGLNHLPSGRFAANAAWLAVQAIAHNLARWTARHRPGRAGGDHQDSAAAILLPRRSAHPLGAPPDPALASALALGGPVHWRPDPIAHPAASLLSVALPDRSAGNRPTILALIHQSVEYLSHSRRTNRPARVPCCLRPPHERLLSPATGHCRPRPPHIRRVGPLSIPVMPCSSALPTPFGGFGLNQTDLRNSRTASKTSLPHRTAETAVGYRQQCLRRCVRTTVSMRPG